MNEISLRMDGQGLVVGIVRARFNEPVGNALLASCVARLVELGVSGERVTVASVPGASSAECLATMDRKVR